MPPRGSLRIHVCAPLHVGGCQRPRPLPPLEKWRFVEAAGNCSRLSRIGVSARPAMLVPKITGHVRSAIRGNPK
jgi:hypothetical protein